VLRAGLAGVAAGAVQRLPTSSAAGPGRPPRPHRAPLTCELTGFRRASTDPSLRAPAWSTPLPRPPVLTGGAVDLPIRAAEVEVLPGRPTPMLTYAGTVPGPTIVARPGHPLAVTLHNGLDEAAVLHLHGVHAPAEHDGHVAHEVGPGASRTYRYPNAQRPATLWYHDHLLMRTADRVHRGLAGAYLLRDPAEADLGLPVDDERDVVVVLADRAFADDGSLVRDPSGHTPVVGDVVLVNGADRPRLDVAAGPVRLRVINGSNARAFRLARSDGGALLQVATDGGLLGAPAPREVVELWPAERVEVLLDLSRADVGTRLLLVDRATDEPILAVDVVDGRAVAWAPPTALPAPPTLPDPEVVRTITLDQDGDRFLLAGHGYDPAVRDVHARLGAVERWRLVNTTTASHPMHLHLVSVLVRGRTTASGGPLALRPEDEGWKDTVLVRPFETVEVDARFADHLGDFLYHCHVLEHEDHDMMSQFRVVDLQRHAGTSRVETAALVAATAAGPRRRVVVADGEDWRGALAGAALADALLLTAGDALADVVAAELRRVPPEEVVVVGTAVPDAVVEAIAAALDGAVPVRRVAGADPVDTAARVALDLAGTAPVAVVATDAVFADALAAGVLGVPVLLTDPAALSSATADALSALRTREVVIAGGPAAVGPAVEDGLRAAGYTTTRVAGEDRTATAAAFARRAGLKAEVWAASAARFPDALGAAVAARRTGASLVLVGDAGASPATAQLLADAGARRLRIAGGEVAVPLRAEADLAARLLV
jgi:spore coat protein A, manganese oxidase